MPSERTGYAPWSLTREAGVQSATVDGTIKVPQNIQPVLDTGFVDERGDWKGVKSSDEVFTIDATHEGIPNGGTTLNPQRANHDFIDMTGYSSLFIAFFPTNAGNYALSSIMGPDTNPFANLTPVAAANNLRACYPSRTDLENVFLDTSEAMTADAWNVIYFGADMFKGQKNMQFNITNNSGGASDMTFAYMRLV
ncbi:MAG: hypothetical protein [Circular genetic element sp.]|nr:MAG: hypothetical protein [Circular genetic element sp.]